MFDDFNVLVSRTSCETSGRFYCDDGLCIERSLRCDGIADCRNGTDELNCGESKIQIRVKVKREFLAIKKSFNLCRDVRYEHN